jgi:hypothetical protein
VRAVIRQEGYSKAEIDMILEWYIDPDVLQLVEVARDGKRNLRENTEKEDGIAGKMGCLGCN